LTTWTPDTCNCKIEFDDKIQWIKTLEKCRLHQPLEKQALLNAVIAYNQSFNLSLGIDPTEQQQRLITLSKAVTKIKIRQGDFSETPPLPIPKPTRLKRLVNFLRLNR